MRAISFGCAVVVLSSALATTPSLAASLICHVDHSIECGETSCRLSEEDQDEGRYFTIEGNRIGTGTGEGSASGKGRVFITPHNIVAAGLLGPTMQGGKPLDDGGIALSLSLTRSNHRFIATLGDALYAGVCD